MITAIRKLRVISYQYDTATTRMSVPFLYKTINGLEQSFLLEHMYRVVKDQIVLTVCNQCGLINE